MLMAYSTKAAALPPARAAVPNLPDLTAAIIRFDLDSIMTTCAQRVRFLPDFKLRQRQIFGV
jgi:hypothetical protein